MNITNVAPTVALNRTRKLTEKEIGTFIEEFYLMPDVNGKVPKVAPFLTAHGIERNQKAFRNHWKCSGLEDMRKNHKSYSEAKEVYLAWQQSEQDKLLFWNRKNCGYDKFFVDDTCPPPQIISYTSYCGGF